MYANDDATKPVALLARAGEARDRLREALVAAGGRIVLEEDPNTLEAGSLQATGAQVVLVALEPAVEDALERLESVLEAPQLSLMFEEAELAARREGWEAQRWIRHMAAKLQGHGNVLPPGSEAESGELLEVVAPVADVAGIEMPLAFDADSATGVEAGHTADALAEPSFASTAATDFQDYDAAWDGDAAADVPAAAAAVAREDAEVLSFEELIAASASRSESVPRSGPPPLPPLEPSAAAAPVESLVEPARPAAATPDFNSWSLVEDEGYAVTPQATPAPVAESPALDSLLTSSLSLLEIEGEGSADAEGAVLLIAGIGGPDAVRRVLAGLPEDFARPVLVQLRLDGGRYANLVKQMARATSLPVGLADPGQPLLAGNIYILPDAIGMEAGAAGLVFSAVPNGLLTAMTPSRSAVLMLSGADTGMVEDVLAFAARGGWVAGQVGEGCYDPAAASQLAVAGMPSGDPEYLAAELAVHCAI